ncbi:hypothetical protein IJM86_08265 [bacterium]|nr:hypothetical protein [bacterium]
MSKARKIVTYLMVGMMVLTNFQNRLYADDEGAEASPSSSASSESSSASSSSDSGGGSSDGGNS